MLILSTTVGAVLAAVWGWYVTTRQRKWDADRQRFERETAMTAGPLHEALIAMHRRILGPDVQDGMSRWEAVRLEWENGMAQIMPGLMPQELADRYWAISELLYKLDYPNINRGAMPGSRTAIALSAVTNARIALEYWIRRDELPPSSFPSSIELNELIKEGAPTPLALDSPLSCWLTEHPHYPTERDDMLRLNENVSKLLTALTSMPI
jgi:hypothetical protein